MNNEKETFEYSYSAKEMAEVRRIREKYLPPEEDKMALLRKLDRRATDKATTCALIVGTIFSLLLGGGMSLCMVWGDRWMFMGIVLGLIGMAGCALAYPLYLRITRRERERVAPQILKLTEELMK